MSADHHDSLELVISQMQSQRARETIAPDWLQLSMGQLEQLWEGSKLAKRIVRGVCDECTRRGWRVTVPGEDVAVRELNEPFKADLDRLRVASTLREADQWARLYGGAVVIIGVDDGRPMSEPIDRARVRKVQYLLVADRWEVTPSQDVETNPDEPWYGQPLTYMYSPSGTAPRIVGSDGQPMNINAQTVHASRVLRFEGEEVSRRRRPMYSGWGAPVLDSVWMTVQRFAATEASLADVLRDFEFGVLSVRGLANMVASADGRSKVIKRASLFAQSKAVSGMAIVDQEGEKYDRSTSQSATGLGEIYDRMLMSMSSVAEMPVTMLFGTPPKGFATDDKSGRTAWYDRVAIRQANVYRAPILYICELLRDSSEGPDVAPDAPINVAFLPLEEPTEKEKAETRLVILQGDKVLWEMGAVDELEIRGREGGAEFSTELTLYDKATRDRIAATEGIDNQAAGGAAP